MHRRILQLPARFLPFVSLGFIALGLIACSDSHSSNQSGQWQEKAESLASALEYLSPHILSCRLSAKSGTRDLPSRVAELLTHAADGTRGALLGTGSVHEFTPGSVDHADDGLPDRCRLELELEIPAGSKSLVIITRFFTSERLEAGAIRQDDSAYALYGFDGEAPTTRLDLGLPSTSFGTHSVRRTHAIDVTGRKRISLALIAEDHGDGHGDSTLEICEAYLSDDPAPQDPIPHEDHRHVGKRADPLAQFADPVCLASGDHSWSKTLIQAPGINLPFVFTIHHRSSARIPEAAGKTGRGPLGPGWRHSYQWSASPSKSQVKITHGDGAADYFDVETRGTVRHFKPTYPGNTAQLAEDLSGAITYRTKNRLEYRFPSIESPIESLRDAHGNALHFSYDTNRRLVSIRDTRGQLAWLNYDSAGRLERVEYAGKRKVTFGYWNGFLSSFELNDELAYELEYLRDIGPHAHWFVRLVKCTAPSGNIVFFNRFKGDQVVEQLDALDNSRKIDYHKGEALAKVEPLKRTTTDGNKAKEIRYFNAAHQVVRAVDAFGEAWRYRYDSLGNVVSETDPLQAETTAVFDSRRNLLRHTDALSGEIRNAYDNDDNPILSTDEVGATTRRTFDARGNLTEEVDPLGAVRRWTYTSQGQVRTVVDPLGRTTRFGYSSSGELTSVSDALGQVKRRTYDDIGQLTSEIDARGNRTQYKYDHHGRLATLIDATGGLSLRRYSKNGKPVEQTGPGGRVFRYEYDKADQLTATVDPEGRRHEYVRDAEGRVTGERDPLGNTLQRTLDATGRVVKVVERDGVTTASALYDKRGLRTEVRDPRGLATRFEYDRLGRLTRIIDPLQRESTSDYDPRGLPLRYRNGRGQTLHYAYDLAGRLVARASANYLQGHRYDRKGNRVRTVTRHIGALAWLGEREIRTSADKLDRLETRTDEFGNELRFTYDATGNLTTLRYPDGKAVRYEYDNLNRMTGVTDWKDRRTSYRYDRSDNLREIIRFDASRVAFDYDRSGLLVGIFDQDHKGGVVTSIRLLRDGKGRIIEEHRRLPVEANPLPDLRRFSYDNANQIAFPSTAGFAHDLDGNMTRGVLEFPQATPPSPMTGESRIVYYRYDKLDRLMEARCCRDQQTCYTMTFQYDASGNIVQAVTAGAGQPTPSLEQGRVEPLSYDEFGRLLGCGGDLFAYDGDGLRTHALRRGRYRRFVQHPTGSLPRVIAEQDAGGRCRARYVYGLGLLYRVNADESVSSYHFDSRGSVLALSNGLGAITDRYAYGPYGRILARTGDSENAFTFCGRHGVVDDGNGLYFMRARYYSPVLMRFIERDDRFMGNLLRTQSLNRYAYADGDPIGRIDPDGEFAILDNLVTGLAGALIGGGIDLAFQLIENGGDFDKVEWSKVAGAALTGFIIGATDGLATGWASGAAIGATASGIGNAVGQGLGNKWGEQEGFDWKDFGVAVALGATFGGIEGRHAPGYNSFSAVRRDGDWLKVGPMAWRRASRNAGLKRILREPVKSSTLEHAIHHLIMHEVFK